jgi:hypothetical protein
MVDRYTPADRKIGAWLSAALDDPKVCEEFRADILEWFEEKEMTSSHKDIPEYDETVVCQNPECKHLEAPAITGLYGMAGGGGLGVYSVCENCGTVLTKSLAPEVCETHEDDEPPKDSPEYPKWVELKANQLRGEPDVKDHSEPKPNHDK